MLHTIIKTSLQSEEQIINELTHHLIVAMKSAGEILLEKFELIGKTMDKHICTAIRNEADEMARKTILNTVYEYGYHIRTITTENGGTVSDDDIQGEYAVVIDSLDGMHNFKLGIQNFSISIAITKGKNILTGLVYNPTTNALYIAHKGQGTTKNGQKIHVNDRDDITHATVSYIHEYRRVSSMTRCEIFGDLIQEKLKRFIIDRSPANDFCLLAEGKIEGILCNQESFYDFCAGKLIALEAGAKLTHFGPIKDDTNNTFVISNKSEKLHNQLCTIFGKYVSN